MNATFIFAERTRRDAVVELVCVLYSRIEDFIERAEGGGGRFRAQSQADFLAASGWNFDVIYGSGFGAGARRIDGVLSAGDQIFVKCVLDLGRRVGLSPKASGIRLVFSEEEFGLSVAT